jgi:lysozyme family protein
MTLDDVLDGVLTREGLEYTNHPEDRGGPTKGGITLHTLRRVRHNPTLTAQDVMTLTVAEIREIYTEVFVREPGLTQANIPYEPLRVQLIDFAVNSGPARAIRWLQRVLGMTGAQITGILDVQTRERISRIVGDWYGFDQTSGRLVNDALVAARCYMIDSATDQGTVSKTFEEGLESRALQFFLARPD